MIGLRHAAVVVALIVAAPIVAALTVPAAPAQGQGTLVASTPADGGALAAPPTEVDLSFSGDVNTDLSHVGASTSAGTTVASGPLRRTGPDRVGMPVTITAAGDYQVSYHAVFTDGTSVAGVVRFTVGTGAPPAGTDRVAAGQALPGHDHDIDPLNAILLAADAVTVLGVAFLLLRRRSSRTALGEQTPSR